jgi:DNA-binding response OmpR family regulator
LDSRRQTIRAIIVEDESGLREQMVAFLNLSGIAAEGVGSATELYRRMAVERFSIVILDLGLPDEDGLSIASHLRVQDDIGIIMTTARIESDDHAQGFKAGADIYMTKPVSMVALVAAVENLARRIRSMDPTPKSRPGVDKTESGDGWIHNLTGFTLTTPDKSTLMLTANENALMNCFAQSADGVVTRAVLLTALKYDASDLNNRSLDAAVRRLRLKVLEQTGVTLPLNTVHGIGYVFKERLVKGRG